MNFKRFHESKNLFDGVIGTDNVIMGQTGSTQVNTSYALSDYISVEPSTTYTYSFNHKEYESTRKTYIITEYNTQKEVIFPIEVYNVNDSGLFSIAFTTSSETRYILINWKKTQDENLMLNTGSQPLPYEPYGSTWTNIPHYIHNTSTDTITTLPAVLYPNAVTATVGLKGQMEQSGTPTPTTPIQPSECGDLTGNLFDGALLSGFYKNASFGLDTSGGTIYKSIKVYLVAGTYTVSFEHNVNIVRQILDGIYSENIGSNIDSYTFTTTTDTYFGISFRLSQSSSTSWDNSNIMLNTGSQPLPYEPYGVKIPISSAGQTTPVYLGEVQSTRQIKKLVLTGEENWKYSTSSQVHWIENVPNDYNNTLISRITTVCTHYRCIQNNTGFSGMVNGDLRLYAKEASPIAHELYIKDDTYTTAADFKTYLQQQYAAGTPVCVWYILANPETAVVNEPLRKIGDYADSVSGITIPTIAGANTLSVDTTLQPSEVTATYKGWHSAQSVHESENGAWD